MTKNISYLTRSFEDYRQQLEDFAKLYYPEVFKNFDDSSIGSFLLDINAAVSDNLSSHIDKTYQETQIDYTQSKKSLLSIARTNGLKVRGKTASMVSTEWNCTLPVYNELPDWRYAPIIRQTSRVNGGGQTFELTEDLDFSEQFDSWGFSNRTYTPIRNNNGIITAYSVSKTGIMYNGQRKIFQKRVTNSDLTPFMNIILPEDNVLSIESIIVKYGDSTPTTQDFYNELSSERWFEVDTLIENEVFTQDLPHYEENGNFNPSTGSWKKTNQKFITEYTDNGYLKVTFGSGSNDLYEPTANNDAKQYLLNHIIGNDSLGILPKVDQYIYILYKVGGGSITNVGINTLNSISTLDSFFSIIDNTSNIVRRSIKVTNNTPAVGGKDELSIEDLRNLIKFNNSSQERCVTLKDYYARVMLMPPKYGSPYKCGVSEENNKIVIDTLTIDPDGHLKNEINYVLRNNIQKYISKYKMINDYVVLRNGKIFNLQFEIYLSINKYSSKVDILTNVINEITNYMSVSSRQIGENVYLSDLTSKIFKIEGVKNIIDVRVYNIFDGEYSQNKTSQNIIENETESNRYRLDLIASDNTLFAESNSMFEIKFPNKDIKIILKQND